MELNLQKLMQLLDWLGVFFLNSHSFMVCSFVFRFFEDILGLLASITCSHLLLFTVMPYLPHEVSL